MHRKHATNGQELARVFHDLTKFLIEGYEKTPKMSCVPEKNATPKHYRVLKGGVQGEGATGEP